MNKHIFHHEKQLLDKSTAHDMSEELHDVDELGENHPIWEINNKPKKDKLFSIIAIPVGIWILTGWLSVKFNIAQGDLKPHSWKLLNIVTAIIFMFWSMLTGEEVLKRILLPKRTELRFIIARMAVLLISLIVFFSSFFYGLLLILNK